MVSTYSPSLRLELMATGDQSGTWGDTTNTNLGELLEQAITGVLSKAMADTDQTLTNSNGAVDEARNMVVTATGALTAARNVIVPDANKLYLFRNQTTGGFAVTIKTSAGTGIAVPMGEARWVYCDGVNVVDGLAGSYARLSGGNVFTGNQQIGGNLILGSQNIFRTVANGATILSGGSTGGLGANIELYGESHATQANNAFIDADVISFRAAAGGANRALISASGFYVGSTSAPTHIVERTGSPINAETEYLNSSGSVFVGHGAANTFAVGASANLTSAPWLTTDGTTTTILSTGSTAYNAATAGAQIGSNTSLLLHNNTNNNGAFAQLVLRQRADVPTDVRLVATGGQDPTLAVVIGTAETARINSTELLLGQTAGWNPSTDALRGINITKNGQFIASNVSNLAGSFVRMSSNGRVLNTYRDTTNVGGATVTTTATSWDTSSDERQKNFIGPYDPLKAIDIIRRDPVRDFYWNHLMGEGEGVYAVGWGAQTSYAISPDLASPGVGEPGDPDFQSWGIDQGKRTPYLWAALTWALDKIDELTARIEALEA